MSGFSSFGLRNPTYFLLLITQPEESEEAKETIEAIKSRYARERSQYPQYAQQSQVAEISFLHAYFPFRPCRVDLRSTPTKYITIIQGNKDYP